MGSSVKRSGSDGESGLRCEESVLRGGKSGLHSEESGLRSVESGLTFGE